MDQIIAILLFLILIGEVWDGNAINKTLIAIHEELEEIKVLLRNKVDET